MGHYSEKNNQQNRESREETVRLAALPSRIAVGSSSSAINKGIRLLHKSVYDMHFHDLNVAISNDGILSGRKSPPSAV
jgi:hypothetical protein